jgi:hypothetical protein
MIGSTSHQAWLFYSPLARQAVLLKDDLLDPVDQLLDDPALVDLVRQCRAARSPLSTRTGRSGMAPDRLLRCCVGDQPLRQDFDQGQPTADAGQLPEAAGADPERDATGP